MSVSIRYTGGSEDHSASIYETYPLETVVAQNLTLFNTEESSDFELQSLIIAGDRETGIRLMNLHSQRDKQYLTKL